jgi:hypothetical protein
MAHSGEPESPVPAVRRQFRIGQLMMATALVAVTLALARGALVVWSAPGANVIEEWNAVAAMCGVAAGASLVVTVPCTLGVLLARSAAVWAAAILLYMFVVTAILLTVIASLAGGGPSPGTSRFLVVSVATFGGVLWGLGIFRRAGYRLVRS